MSKTLRRREGVEWLLDPRHEVAEDFREAEVRFRGDSYRLEEEKIGSADTEYTAFRLFHQDGGEERLVAAATYDDSGRLPDLDEVENPYLDDVFAVEYGFDEEKDSVADIYSHMK